MSQTLRDKTPGNGTSGRNHWEDATDVGANQTRERQKTLRSDGTTDHHTEIRRRLELRRDDLVPQQPGPIHA